MTCYGLVRTATCQQEWYESASRDARRRAKELRKAGFRVCVSPMGSQVTSEGRVNMTLVSVMYPGDREIPAPEKVSA